MLSDPSSVVPFYRDEGGSEIIRLLYKKDFIEIAVEEIAAVFC